MHVAYEPVADRLLLRLRTRDAQRVALWLTRRMVMRLWPHYRQAVAQLAVARQAPGSTAVPEAQAMLAEAARETALRRADFRTAFDDSGHDGPLGAEPMLPVAADLGPAPDGALRLAVRDTQGRQLELRLGEDLAHGLATLLEATLAKADWGLALPSRPATAAAPAAPPTRVLN